MPKTASTSLLLLIKELGKKNNFQTYEFLKGMLFSPDTEITLVSDIKERKYFMETFKDKSTQLNGKMLWQEPASLAHNL